MYIQVKILHLNDSAWKIKEPQTINNFSLFPSLLSLLVGSSLPLPLLSVALLRPQLGMEPSVSYTLSKHTTLELYLKILNIIYLNLQEQRVTGLAS